MFLRQGARRSRPRKRCKKQRDSSRVRVLCAEPLEQRNLLTVINLANVTTNEGLILASSIPQDRAGFSVGGIGDVNRDGLDDVIVGAPVDLQSIAGTGQAYVVNGRPDGANVFLPGLNGVNGGTPIFGVVNEDRAGFSVSGAGDVNGDGAHDLAIGAPYHDAAPGLTGTGESYLFFGGFTGIPSPSTLNGSNGFIVESQNFMDRAGFSVSGAGDVNGDGFSDLLVGLPVAAEFEVGQPGRTFLVYGKPSGFAGRINLDTIPTTDGVPLIGIGADDHMGFSVSGAGDINGDGFDDLIIGAPFADRVANGNLIYGAGQSYLLFGGFTTAPNLAALDGSNGFRLDGLAGYDRAGWSVSGAGDINGDGFDDLAVGAPSNSSITGGPGQAYVVFGKGTNFAPVVNLWELNGTDGFQLLGVANGDRAGLSVSGAGDVNGDGFDDLILGAPYHDRFGATADYGVGESYVVFGKNTAFPSLTALGALADSDGFSIEGHYSYDRSGFSVGDAGDVNGDGIDDLIVGSPGEYDQSIFRTGRSYVLFGWNEGSQSIRGDASDNNLEGDANANVIVGGLGNDTLAGRGGRDVLFGGAGSDVLGVSDLNFFRLVGGNGEDTIRLDGNGLTFNLTAIPDNRLLGIEGIDVRGDGANQLDLGNVREVLNLSDNSNALRIRRDADDTVNIGTGWLADGSETIDGVLYQRLRQGAASLLLENLPPLVDLNGPNGAGIDHQAEFIEDGGATVIVDSDLSLVDDSNIVSATVTLTTAPDGDNESLSATTVAGISASYDAPSRTLSLTGAATFQAYESVLRTLSYENVLDNPDTSDRLVEVVANDGDKISVKATVTVSVTPVNDAPVLGTTGASQLTAIAEDSTDPAGDTVGTIVADGSITDPDGSATESIAIIGADSRNGTWQYMSGGAWIDLGTVSGSAARLLATADRVRFIPAGDFNGTATINYRAWDQSSGSAGDSVDTRVNGGTSAFSQATGSASISVTPVNDAPVLNASFDATLFAVHMNNSDPAGTPVHGIVPSGSISDADGIGRKAIAIISVDNTNGTWQHSVDGASWNAITVSDAAALLANSNRLVRFVPNIDFLGTATMVYRAWDRSTGADGETADTSITGGTTAFSTESETAEVTVTDDDAAPTLDEIASPIVLSGTGSQQVNLTGISDGADDGETLTVTATSSNTGVLPDPVVTYSSPDSTGTLTLTPSEGTFGWVLITVSVTEVDMDVVSRQFHVSVGDNPLVWQNPANRFDVSADGIFVAGDILTLINEINDPQFIDEFGRLPAVPPNNAPPPFYDVNGDLFATPVDALQAINLINRTGGEGESTPDPNNEEEFAEVTGVWTIAEYRTQQRKSQLALTSLSQSELDQGQVDAAVIAPFATSALTVHESAALRLFEEATDSLFELDEFGDAVLQTLLDDLTDPLAVL